MSEEKTKGEAGKALSAAAKQESNGFSLTPSLTSLLKPTTDYLGLEIRDYVKNKVEELKARKRKENVKAHMESVGVQLGIPLTYDEESVQAIKQLDLFDEWIEGAQQVDPNVDETLAKLWQGLLLDIVQGKAHNRMLVNTLKQLEANEAALLLQFKGRRLFHPRGTEERFVLRKLRRLELIEFDWFFLSTLVASYVLMIAMVFAFPGTGGFFEKDVNATFVAVFSLLPVSAMIALIPKYKASWLGKKLLSYVSDADARKARDA